MKTYKFNLKAYFKSPVNGEMQSCSDTIKVEGNYHSDHLATIEAKRLFKQRNIDCRHLNEENIVVLGFSVVENRTLNVDKPRSI